MPIKNVCVCNSVDECPFHNHDKDLSASPYQIGDVVIVKKMTGITSAFTILPIGVVEKIWPHVDKENNFLYQIKPLYYDAKQTEFFNTSRLYDIEEVQSIAQAKDALLPGVFGRGVNNYGGLKPQPCDFWVDRNGNLILFDALHLFMGRYNIQDFMNNGESFFYNFRIDKIYVNFGENPVFDRQQGGFVSVHPQEPKED